MLQVISPQTTQCVNHKHSHLTKDQFDRKLTAVRGDTFDRPSNESNAINMYARYRHCILTEYAQAFFVALKTPRYKLCIHENHVFDTPLWHLGLVNGIREETREVSKMPCFAENDRFQSSNQTVCVTRSPITSENVEWPIKVTQRSYRLAFQASCLA